MSGEPNTTLPIEAECTCSRGHPPHFGHCSVLACGCYADPPTCAVCNHKPHRLGAQCYGTGVKDPCICKGEGITSRKEVEDHAYAEARGRGKL